MVRILPELFEQTALSYPGKPAYKDSEYSLTFSETLDQCRAIAAGLSGASLFRRPVALFIEKSVACVTAILGTAMSGNFYTVIDTQMPPERIRVILDTLQPAAVLTTRALAGKARSVFSQDGTDLPVLLTEELTALSFDPEKVRETMRRIQPDDLLFVLFTSGSTGVPKGVMATHAALMNYISCWEEVFAFSEKDILLSQVPFCFVMSVLDIFAPAVFGAELHIIPQMYYAFPVCLLKYIEENRVTALVWVTSALSILAGIDAFSAADLSSIRKVLFGGEVMPIRVLNAWRSHVPDAFYVNGYGSTELLDGGVFYRVDRDFAEGEVLPIGRPFPHMDIFLLDEEDRLVTGAGVTGELCARGVSVSAGYYNDPEKTAAAFVRNPLQTAYEQKIFRTGDLAKYNERGELVYAGRKDLQIKFLGHRIEPGEIEAAADTDGVNEIAVVYDGERKRIVAFYTGTATGRELTKLLHERVPDYMIPRRFVRLEEMPHNVHDKIDRRALGAMTREVD